MNAVTASAPSAAPPLARAAIERLLRPRSIAIVGASATPSALGAAVLRNLERAGYAGDIHLINPRRSEIGGRPCVATVDDLPDGVDCAVLAVPREAVLPVIAACGRKGVGSAVIYAAGFAEGGDEGRAQQDEIARLAAQYGMAIEGPNCLGMVNYVDGAPLTFVEVPAVRLGTRRGVAIASQSGAMAAVLNTGLNDRELGISFSISTGNEAASGLEDYLDYLVDDPATSVIAIIAEHFRSPRRLIAFARRARAAGKPVVLLHPGRSDAARASAATHTGAMAGDHAIMRVKVEHEGIILAETLEVLIDVTEILLRCPAAAGPGLARGTAVLTESGAFKAHAHDLCEEVGLALPPLSAQTDAKLRALFSDFIPTSNPLDITAQGLVNPQIYFDTLNVLLADDDYGSVLMGIILSDIGTSSRKLGPVIEAIRTLRPDKPVLFSGLDEGAEVPADLIRQLREHGVPVFRSAERAIRALAVLARAAARRPDAGHGGEDAALRCALPSGMMPEYRAKAVLAEAGLPVPVGGLAVTPDEAKAIAARIGYPVVLKAQAAALPHKSDVGGVVLNLGDEAALAAGWDRLQTAVARARPDLTLDGVLVEAMGPRGTELIVGAHVDADWGPVLLVGFGGVLAEAIRDVRLIVPELSPEGIERELLKLKTAALLTGFRGAPALDVPAAARIVARLGAMMLANDAIREVDINPVVVFPAGQGAIALDALIVAA
ncbi:acetate--CoA ligase family protein [Pseudoxanthobacter sp.]|uniref:acetate--CoA ligase family protein n=1 Tax=Pseudoxanthobacter sp. TaxID=1925742 RepID=UPI002FE171FF